jgi:UDP-glucose 4-epimerase
MRSSIGVVGPNGFIGKSLVSHLKSFDCDLKLIDRARFEEIRRNFDYSDLVKHDYLIWLATSVNPITAQESTDLVKSDLTRFEEFLNRLRDTRSIDLPTIILFSSGGCVYSGKDAPFREESPALGSNSYGRYKLDQEMLLIASGIPHVILRAANIYGPGQQVGRGQGVIAEWVEAAVRDKPIQILGSLDTTRDFLYIDDLVLAIEKVLQQKFLGTINIGSGIATSLYSVLELLEFVAGKQFNVENCVARSIDRSGYFLDISKANLQLNWSPKTSLFEGIQKTFEFKKGSRF